MKKYATQDCYFWWSVPGSNRWPSACKADALPAELTPLAKLLLNKMVGRGGLEPPTSRLSGVRSNHLSYRPSVARCADCASPWQALLTSKDAGKGQRQAYYFRLSWPLLCKGTVTRRTSLCETLAEEIWGRLGPKGHLAMPWIWSVLFTDLLSDLRVRTSSRC